MNSLLVTESAPKILAIPLSYHQKVVTVNLAMSNVKNALFKTVMLAFYLR